MTSIFMRRPHLREIPTVAPLPAGYALRRACSPRDDAPLAAMLTAAFGERWEMDCARERLTCAPDVRAVYIVTRGEQIAATASHRVVPERWPDAGCVHWVGTHPDHTRRGLASALLAHLLGEFAARGHRAAVLETQEFRVAAIRAYLKFGFLPMYEEGGEDHRAVWSAIMQKLFAA